MIARKLGAITKWNTLEFELWVTNCCWNSPLEPWWGHQLETFSTLLVLCAGNSLVTSEFLTQSLVTPSFDVFLICAWTNGWVNNWHASYLRLHHTHYDAIVMEMGQCAQCQQHCVMLFLFWHYGHGPMDGARWLLLDIFWDETIVCSTWNY